MGSMKAFLKAAETLRTAAVDSPEPPAQVDQLVAEILSIVGEIDGLNDKPKSLWDIAQFILSLTKLDRLCEAWKQLDKALCGGAQLPERWKRVR